MFHRRKPAKPKASRPPPPQRLLQRQDDEDESLHRLFPVRVPPSLGSMESFAVMRRASDVFAETSTEEILTTRSTTNLEKVPLPKIIVTGTPSEESMITTFFDPIRIYSSGPQTESITSGPSGPVIKDKKVKPKGKGKSKTYEGTQHSDLDVVMSRPPMIHRMNILEYIWLYNAGSRLTVFILAALLCIFIAHFVFAIWLFSLGEKGDHAYICSSPPCRNLRNRILRTLNRSVDPCNDFYAFVCGTSQVTTNLPPAEEINWKYGNDAGRFTYDFDRSFSLGRMLEHREEFPHNLVVPFYQACLQEDERKATGLQPYYNLLKTVNLYHIKKDTPLTGAQVIDSMGRILAYSLDDSAMLSVGYYKSEVDGKIRSFVGPIAGGINPFRGGFVYRYGYQLYHDTIRNSFKLLTELQITDQELDILPHDILCLDLYLRDLTTIDNDVTVSQMPILEAVFSPDVEDSRRRKKCELGKSYTGTSPQANFGHPGSGDFDYALLIKTMFAVANPGWDIAKDPIPPEYDHTDPKNDPRSVFPLPFLDAFETVFRMSAPIRLVRYLQWRILLFMSLELDDETIKVVINVRRHAYLGRIPNCFHAVFHSMPFLASDKFLQENSDIGLDEMDKKFTEHSKRIDSVFRRAVMASEFEDFQKFSKSFKKNDLDLLRKVLDSYLSVENIPPTDFHAKNFPSYPQLYKDISFDRKNHFSNVLEMGYRRHQWKANLKYSRTYFGISPIYREIWIDKVRQTYEHVKAFYRIYVPLASIETPFFQDGLAVADSSGLGSVLAEATQKVFTIAAVYPYSRRTDYLYSILAPQYSKQDITDMRVQLHLYLDSIHQNFLVAQLKSWEMGKEISQRLKYKSSERRVLDTIFIDISRYTVLAESINEFLRDPKNHKESEYVLKGLEEYNAKHLFYITLMGRLCEKFGINEYDHISHYGPLPQALRNNIVLSNLDDFGETFQCPIGTPMNRRDKVYFWDKDMNISAFKAP